MKFFKKFTDSFLNLFKFNVKDVESKIDQKIEAVEASIKTQVVMEQPVVMEPVKNMEPIKAETIEPTVKKQTEEVKVETVKDIKSQTKKPIVEGEQKQKPKRPRRKPRKKQEEK